MTGPALGGELPARSAHLPARSAHLVERAASLLRADAGLTEEGGPWAVAAGQEAALAEAEPPPPIAAAAPPAEPASLPASAAPDDRPVPEAPAPGAPPADDRPLAADAPPMLDMAALQRAGLVLAGGRSRIAEEYRITVSRALRALRGSRAGRTGTANLLMVTSARPGEGKSFSALNIAASIAQNGLSDVLLVDVDSKPRSLSALLGLGGREGLLDLATGGASGTVRHVEALLARTAIDGLSVLPVGARRPGVEGAVTRAVSTALERLGRRFPRHVIVLDTAPCLSTSDPSTLAQLVDEVILVVEAERTQRSEVDAALELLKAASNITLVLNKVRLTQRHSFGSYYYFDEPG